jgi:hypothetical protein
MKKFGLFNQPKNPSLKQMRPTAPWAFDPSSADQRAAPSATAGDYYGTGYKNPVGRMRDDSVGYRPVSKKQMGTPPTTVV